MNSFQYTRCAEYKLNNGEHWYHSVENRLSKSGKYDVWCGFDSICLVGFVLKLYRWTMLRFHTGWPKSKSGISNGSESVTKHSWPHVGKAKIGLRGGSFFSVSADFCNIQNIAMKNGNFNYQALWSSG